MKRVDMSNVQEAGSFDRLPAGVYICSIMAVDDVPDKEYLKVTYDIAEGEHKGYYGEIRKAHPEWAWSGAYVKSYKTAALPMFKRFCSAVSKSNGNYVFDGNTVNADEKTLIGKKIGLILRDEEYYGNDGNLKTRLFVDREFAIGDFSNQKQPTLKKLDPSKLKPGTTPTATTGRPESDGFMNIPEGADGEEVPF